MIHEQYPSKLLEKAIQELTRLPGVGRKTALRFALYLLSQKKETGSFRKNGSRASESQIYRTGTDPAFLPYRCIRKAYGNQPVGCFFHAHGKTAPEQQISGGNCVPGADHCGNVYTGKVFLPVSLSHGSGFCINANPSGCTVSEKP